MKNLIIMVDYYFNTLVYAIVYYIQLATNQYTKTAIVSVRK
jgi:hypothetical protein